MSILEAIEIKPFTLQYLEDVSEIHFQVQDGWSIKGLISDIANSATHSYVAVRGGRAVSFCCYLVTDDAELEFVCTHPAFRQQGIATKLLKETIGLLPENVTNIVLEVRRGNRPALSLYDRMGFKKIGERKDFYTTPTESAVVMELTRYGVKYLD